MQRNLLESHIECATKSHLDLACGELRDTQEKLKGKIKDFHGLEESVNILHEQLEEKVNDIQQQHRNNVDLIQQQHQRRVNILQEKLEQKVQEQLEKKVKSCQTKIEQKISMERKIFLVCFGLALVFLACVCVGMVRKDLENEFQRVQTNLQERVSVIQSLRERIVTLDMDPGASHIFIWKITSFENQVKSNTDRYMESVPFYTHGYKLMLGLYPNGYDAGKNTHLSIFVFVLKGEYDVILPWGFPKKVTITLIDQQDNPKQRKDVVMGFNANPNKKPLEGENRVGLGSSKFVSHSDLRTRRFIVDDTLFIKFQVG